MYLAMNRFQINDGKEEAFETIWRERDSSLNQLPGFKTFHLLKGEKNVQTAQSNASSPA